MHSCLLYYSFVDRCLATVLTMKTKWFGRRAATLESRMVASGQAATHVFSRSDRLSLLDLSRQFGPLEAIRPTVDTKDQAVGGKSGLRAFKGSAEGRLILYILPSQTPSRRPCVGHRGKCICRNALLICISVHILLIILMYSRCLCYVHCP